MYARPRTCNVTSRHNVSRYWRSPDTPSYLIHTGFSSSRWTSSHWISWTVSSSGVTLCAEEVSVRTRDSLRSGGPSSSEIRVWSLVVSRARSRMRLLPLHLNPGGELSVFSDVREVRVARSRGRARTRPITSRVWWWCPVPCESASIIRQWHY